MKRIIIIFLFICAVANLACTQNDSISMVKPKPKKNTVFIEYLGKDYFSVYDIYYTVNYSRQLFSYKHWSTGIRVGGILSHTRGANEIANTFYHFLWQNKYNIWMDFSIDAEVGYVYYRFENGPRSSNNILSFNFGARYDGRHSFSRIFYHRSNVVNPAGSVDVEAWDSSRYQGIGISIGLKF